MPMTSVFIPKEMMEYVDSLTQNGKVRSFKQLVLELLQFHKRFTMDEWVEGIFFMQGLRHAFLAQRSVKILIGFLAEDKQYQAGRKMGKTWVDYFFAKFRKTISQENWSQALKVLELAGWGHFEFDGEIIMIKRPFLPLPLMHGYLETGLSVKLERLEATTDEIGVFKLAS